MVSVTAVADEYWSLLKRQDPYYAMVSGEQPLSIQPLDERTVGEQSAEADRLLDQLAQTVPESGEEDLAAVLEAQLTQQAARIDQMWHTHPTTPYQSSGILVYAEQVIAPQQGATRARLTEELAARIRSIAAIVREQRSRGIALPRPAVPGARATWLRIRTQVAATLDGEHVADACGEVLDEIAASGEVAGDKVGMAHLRGGEGTYRDLVRQKTTLYVEPEELHRLGLEQCAELSEAMADVRSRLGGPADESAARDWVQGQRHLYADSPDAVASVYRRHIERVDLGVVSQFRSFPQAGFDIRRADASAEAGMTFGYYQPPTPAEPMGLYRFNGSGLATRSQLAAAALILHELIPGHHFHIARQRENGSLHPLQQHSLDLGAFNEGWGEYASGLGWKLGVYQDDWDAYGRLSHERFTAQRLVVDTAVNLGLWDRDRAESFMYANTLEGYRQIGTEVLRYGTDLPAQALAYRCGYLAFRQARESAPGLDVRDVHEAMIGGGAVPLRRMQQRVLDSAERELSDY